MTPLIARAGTVLIIALLIMAGVVMIYDAVFEKGERYARQAIEQQNQEAGNAADDARSRFDRGCPYGLRFDFATGQCVGLATRSGP